MWTPTHDPAKAGRPARTYIQQLCEDTGCCPEDLPEAMNDREKWWERVRDIRATSTTWWWWWWWKAGNHFHVLDFNLGVIFQFISFHFSLSSKCSLVSHPIHLYFESRKILYIYLFYSLFIPHLAMSRIPMFLTISSLKEISSWIIYPFIAYWLYSLFSLCIVILIVKYLIKR